MFNRLHRALSSFVTPAANAPKMPQPTDNAADLLACMMAPATKKDSCINAQELADSRELFAFWLREQDDKIAAYHKAASWRSRFDTTEDDFFGAITLARSDAPKNIERPATPEHDSVFLCSIAAAVAADADAKVAGLLDAARDMPVPSQDIRAALRCCEIAFGPYATKTLIVRKRLCLGLIDDRAFDDARRELYRVVQDGGSLSAPVLSTCWSAISPL